MIQLKLMRLIASAACMAGLVLTTVSGVAHSQESAPAVASASGIVSPVVATTLKATTIAVESPYGLESLWKTSDGVAKTVLLLLLIMSAGSWYILIVKLLEQSKMVRQAKAAAKDFWPQASIALWIASRVKPKVGWLFLPPWAQFLHLSACLVLSGVFTTP